MPEPPRRRGSGRRSRMPAAPLPLGGRRRSAGRPGGAGPSRPSRRRRSGPSCSSTTRRTCARILAERFARGRLQGRRGRGPGGGGEEGGRARQGRRSPFLLVTDLGMPTSGGTSFQGGFEVVKRLGKMNLRPPVLMMTESLSPALQAARAADGDRVLRLQARPRQARPASSSRPTCAPSPSKLLTRRPAQAREAACARRRAAKPAAQPGAVPRPRGRPPSADGRWPRGSSSSCSAGSSELRAAGRRQPDRDAGDEGGARVLRARRPLPGQERRGCAGLGGFGPAPRDEKLNLLAREVAIPLGGALALPRRGRRTGRPLSRAVLPDDKWTRHLMGKIGRFQSHAVRPLPARHPPRDDRRPLRGQPRDAAASSGRLDALEMFVDQAGVALENAFLQRKIQALQDAPERALGAGPLLR